MKTPLTLLLLVLTFASKGQEYSLPKMKLEGVSANDFSPKGWFVSDSIQGDINKDQIDDIVFILQKKKKITVTDKTGDDISILPKVLIVAIKNTSGKFQIKDINKDILIDNNLPPHDGPSFGSMEIQNNTLTLNFTFDYINANFYTYNYRFRLQKNQFVLIGADIEYVKRSNTDYEKASFNFLNKKWSRTTGIHPINGDFTVVNEKTEWFDLEFKQLKNFTKIGQPGSWNITKEIWL